MSTSAKMLVVGGAEKEGEGEDKKGWEGLERRVVGDGGGKSERKKKKSVAAWPRRVGGEEGRGCAGEGKSESENMRGPKLEDFLGGGCELKSIAAGLCRSAAAEKATAPPPPPDSRAPPRAPSANGPLYIAGSPGTGGRGVTRRTCGTTAAAARARAGRSPRRIRQGGESSEGVRSSGPQVLGSDNYHEFPVSDYQKELEEMKNMTRQEFVASLRRYRKSSGFSRGASIYRGVTRHHQHGRWQARIGRVAGNKDLYLGTFSTQEEAAEAYDIAAIKFRGLNAVTNFDISRYDVKSIISGSLPIGGMSGRTSKASESSSSSDTIGLQAKQQIELLPINQDQDYWSLLALHHHQQQQSDNQALGLGFGGSLLALGYCGFLQCF
uniref:AP2/ERF domain-containing protein n=1 Tax=Ananas comosus var. bracteatus TaxID=296719 RepID=A0A6V7P5I4_ANACO|nr:unnamed protein product [Ananas comosus var. bracteatus]